VKPISPRLIGTWRIVSMEVWGQAAVDLCGPGLELDAEGGGQMRFVAVEAWLDCEPKQLEGQPAVEFSWQGTDDGDPCSGRGWVRLSPDENVVEGWFQFHLGDTSAFRASRSEGVKKPRHKASASSHRRPTMR
jgi:hypothetical protein